MKRLSLTITKVLLVLEDGKVYPVICILGAFVKSMVYKNPDYVMWPLRTAVSGKRIISAKILICKKSLISALPFKALSKRTTD